MKKVIHKNGTLLPPACIGFKLVELPGSLFQIMILSRRMAVSNIGVACAMAGSYSPSSTCMTTRIISMSARA